MRKESSTLHDQRGSGHTRLSTSPEEDGHTAVPELEPQPIQELAEQLDALTVDVDTLDTEVQVLQRPRSTSSLSTGSLL
ncbi:hypothetical protein ACIBW9_37290 [Streptomyces sp. NPDC049541]|uniref:hypothetical protein n=1 Tax=Streptomyces sp. NPDC049541 TaxID=3365594 RepID=UPI0037AC8ACF